MTIECRRAKACQSTLVLVLPLIITCLEAASARANERAAELVNSFAVMCTIDPLDFARSDAKAAAMKLPIQQDLKQGPNAAGHFIHSKSWRLPLKSGPHEFSVSEALGAKGFVRRCGIAAADIAGEEFRTELIRAFKLNRPASESSSADGTLTTAIWNYGQTGSKLMFSRRTDRTGIYLFLQTLAAR